MAPQIAPQIAPDDFTGEAVDLGTSPFNAMTMTAAFVAIGLPQCHSPFLQAILSAAYAEQKQTFEMADCWLVRYIPGDPFAECTRKQRTNHANYQRRKLRDWQEATGIQLVAIRPGMATRDGLKIPTKYSINFIDYLKELESSVSLGQKEDEIRFIASKLARERGWHRDQWKHKIKKEKPVKSPQDKLKTARTQALGAISKIESLAPDSASRDHLFGEIQRRLKQNSYDILCQAAGIPVEEEEVSPLDAIDAVTESLTEMLASLSPGDQAVARMRCAEKGIFLTDDEESWEGDAFEKVTAHLAARQSQILTRAETFGYRGNPADFPTFSLDCNQVAMTINSLGDLREAVNTQTAACGNYFEAEDHILSTRAAEFTPDTVPSFGYTRRHNGITLEEWLSQEHGLSTELIQ